MNSLLREAAIIAGFTTPSDWKVPRSRQPYIVTARDAQKEVTVFATHIDKRQPNQLREIIFQELPDTIDYRFQAVSRQTMHEIGREVVKNQYIGQAIEHYVLTATQPGQG